MQDKEIENIILLCKQGNQDAKRVLFEMFSPKMLALCNRYLNNMQDAQDAMIDGFIAVYDNIDGFVHRNLQGWINRIMINTCLEMMRKQKKILLQEDNSFADADNEIEIDNPERFSKNDVLNALQTLTPNEKTIFNMAVVDEMSHDEISQILNLKKTTIKTTIYKAKIKLRNYLLQLEKDRI